MTLYWGWDGESWEPKGGRRVEWREVAPGDLIAANRAIWRVAEVRDVPVPDWDEHDREYFEQAREYARTSPGSVVAATDEDSWQRRPLYVIVTPAGGGKRRRIRVRPYAGFRVAYVLHPHYPVCTECGEPWPCREIDITQEVAAEAAKLAALESILPGCCWACGEPVTHRQNAIRFSGDNLLLPSRPGPLFHLRRKCLSGAIQYERQWVPAAEGRRWRLSCPGRLIIHVDGPDCTEDPLCPGPQARHGTFANHPSMLAARVMGFGAEDCLRCSDALARGERRPPAEPTSQEDMKRLGGES